MSDRTSPVFTATTSVQPFEAAELTSGSAVNGQRKSQNASRLADMKAKTFAEAQRMGEEAGRVLGFAEGYEEGLKVGTAKAKAEADAVFAQKIGEFVQQLGLISQNLHNEIERWFYESEEKMTDLALEALKKLLSAELTLSRESALDIVKAALSDVTHSRHAKIRISPFDSALLNEHRQQILEAAGSLRDVEFVNDSSISAGCVIETDGGIVDASLNTKLALIEEAMGRAA